MMRFTLRRRLTIRGFKWSWNLKARNGEIIAQGESYSRRIDAVRAIELVQASSMAVIDEER